MGRQIATVRIRSCPCRRNILGIADYLSRHPTKSDGLELKAEILWKEWFTVNSVFAGKIF